MLVDLIPSFRKLLPPNLQSAPAKLTHSSIEAELCAKQAEDILARLKKILTLLTANK
jgi:hypothetical protein